MMYYWPLAPMLRSPELQPEHKADLMTLGTAHATMSESTLTACHRLACKLPACKSLVIMSSEGAPMRRVYLKHPTNEEWDALERGGFVTAFNNFGFIMDALH